MAKRTKPGTPRPCACQSFAVLDGETVTETTGCTKVVPRRFAQGHDAKLKSLLIRAGVAGYRVRWTEDDQTREGDPLAASRLFGFGHQVESGIRGRLDKLARRAEKKAAKAQPRVVAIKVGRHVYAGATIDPATGAASYTTRSGEAKTAAAGKFTIQEEN
ncbi:hypothetical protein [Micromonospora avicenniae]|uniref:Uncharacterized protein n=1 Tax=Micromonospora avicenniae TaxID=1198245 RepID=A0A1N6YF11_9ACTN|nr:hypothetical protein [Micromonospora avicenniae]SIR13138.1 hypothetical protein SAMN05444858_106280 [Micromonospora avicenniae]